MAVNTELYLNDKLHYSTGVVVTAGASAGSGTDVGYDPAYVQDTNLMEGWKGPSGTTDVWLAIDGLVNTWLNSSATGTIHMVVAYDARGTTQSIIRLKSDAADNPAGAFAEAVTTLSLQWVNPMEDRVTFSLTALRRYYRLQVLNSDRGGGTTLPIIKSVSFYLAETDTYMVSTSWPGMEIGPGDLAVVSNSADTPTLSGHISPSKTGRPHQEIDISFYPQPVAMWETLRNRLATMGINNRAFYIRVEGLRNDDGPSNFRLVRLVGEGNYVSERKSVAVHGSTFKVRTSARPI